MKLSEQLRGVFVDPTFAFAINTLVSIFFLSPDEKTLTVNPHLPEPKEVLKALLDPAFIVG